MVKKNKCAPPTIISETQDYLIINKPASLLVHPPHLHYPTETLVDMLKKVYPEIQSVGDDTLLRPGIVHRLDALVSGVMVVARTQSFFEWIKSQFRERRVHKSYIALVYGRVVRDEGEIKLPLKVGRGKTVVVPEGVRQSGVKKAQTYFEVIQKFQHYTLVEIVLTTGRTHQIRAHFAHFGHSIVGDRQYCHPRYRNRTAFTKYVESDRVFLHQRQLGFYNCSGRYVEYQASLPDELKLFLMTLS